MDVEHEFICALVDEGDFTIVLDNNVTEDWFGDEAHRRVFVLIRSHYAKWTEMPSRAAIKRNYPTYKLPAPVDTIQYLLDELRKQFLHAEVKDALLDIQDALGEGDPVAAFAALTASANRINTDATVLKDVMLTQTWDERLERYRKYRDESDDGLRGLPTGFRTLDLATMGLQPEQLITLVGLPKSGKAQPLDEQVLTPDGWVLMGDIVVGDHVVAHNGEPTRVFATRDWEDREVWRVTTDDGGTALVDREHEWTIHPHGLSKRTVPTWAIADALTAGKDRYAVLPLVEVVHPVADLPVDPYVVGALLGDGGMSGGSVLLTKRDLWLHEEVRRRLPAGCSTTWAVEGLTTRLLGMNEYARQLGLFGLRSWEKHIPMQYLQGSVKQRLDLLAGLLDTDGGMSSKKVEFSTTSELLAGQVQQLVWSLGGCCTSMSRVTRHQGGVGRLSWRLTMRLPTGNPFRLPRKREAWEKRGSTSARPPSRRIVSAEKVREGQRTRCLQVENPQGLYVTRDYLVTHNSTLALIIAMAVQRYIDARDKVLVIGFEMSNDEQAARYDSFSAHISHHALLSGGLDAVMEKKLIETSRIREEGAEMILAADPSGMTTLSGIAAKIQEHKPVLCVVDGAYLLDDENGEPKGSSQALTNITRGLKRMAQRTKMPILCTTQALASKVGKRSGVQLDSIGYCVDTETEIFTQRGWLRYDEVRPGDKTYALDHSTGDGVWSAVQDVHVFSAMPRRSLVLSGPRVGVDSVSTEKHRWPVLQRTRAGLVREWRTSETLNTNSYLPLAAPCVTQPREAKYADEFVELVAWWWTEGGVQVHGPSVITQSEIVNGPNVKRIERCLQAVFGDAQVGRTAPGSVAWRVYRRGNNAEFWLSKAATQVVQGVAPDRRVSLDWLRELTHAQLRLFIETSMTADRCGERSLAQKDRGRTEAFQYACILAGVPTTLRWVPPQRTTPEGMWLVTLKTRHVATPFAGRKNRARWETRTEVVWCPTTEHYNWLARRNGRMYFTGNTSSFAQDSDLVIAVQADEDDPTHQILRVVASRIGPKVETSVLWNWETGEFAELSDAKPPDAPTDRAKPTINAVTEVLKPPVRRVSRPPGKATA